MFGALIQSAVRRRLTVIAVIAGLTAVFASQAHQLQVDNSLAVWFVEDDPTLVSYESFLEEFGSDEVDGVARVHSLTGLGLADPADNAALQAAAN